jgi:phospholipid/cholesterol/gamma-HCH transport system substrate-binding protein
MDTKVNYIIVGLFVTFLTLGIIGATIWLAGVGSAQHYDTYITYMNEAVTGLSEKAAIKFNGVDVGYVSNISLNPKNPQQVRLILKIQQGTPINESTRSSLLALGITGINFVGLTAEEVHAPPLKKLPGEEYPIIPWKPSLFFRLDKTVQEMSDHVGTVAKNLNELLNDQNKEAFKNSLDNIQKITSTFEKNSQSIDQTIQSIKKLSENTATASDKLPQIIKDFETAADNLKTLSKTGSRSLDDLSQQTLPMAQDIMLKLKSTLQNIEQLSGELNKNPAMLIRGRKPAPLGPGE